VCVTVAPSCCRNGPGDPRCPRTTCPARHPLRRPSHLCLRRGRVCSALPPRCDAIHLPIPPQRDTPNARTASTRFIPLRTASITCRRMDSWASGVKNRASGFFTMPNHITTRTICRLERVLVSNVLWLARPPHFERTSGPIEVNDVSDRALSRRFVCTLNDRTNSRLCSTKIPKPCFGHGWLSELPAALATRQNLGIGQKRQLGREQWRKRFLRNRMHQGERFLRRHQLLRILRFDLLWLADAFDHPGIYVP